MNCICMCDVWIMHIVCYIDVCFRAFLILSFVVSPTPPLSCLSDFHLCFFPLTSTNGKKHVLLIVDGRLYGIWKFETCHLLACIYSRFTCHVDSLLLPLSTFFSFCHARTCQSVLDFFRFRTDFSDADCLDVFDFISDLHFKFNKSKD